MGSRRWQLSVQFCTNRVVTPSRANLTVKSPIIWGMSVDTNHLKTDEQGIYSMAEDEESESKYGKIVQWKDEKTLLKLGDFVEIIGGPHFGQRGRITELFESKIALIELESKQRVKVKHTDFVLFRDRPPRHSEN
jgi:transcription antitermination factor NusG